MLDGHVLRDYHLDMNFDRLSHSSCFIRPQLEPRCVFGALSEFFSTRPSQRIAMLRQQKARKKGRRIWACLTDVIRQDTHLRPTTQYLFSRYPNLCSQDGEDWLQACRSKCGEDYRELGYVFWSRERLHKCDMMVALQRVQENHSEMIARHRELSVETVWNTLVHRDTMKEIQTRACLKVHRTARLSFVEVG